MVTCRAVPARLDELCRTIANTGSGPGLGVRPPGLERFVTTHTSVGSESFWTTELRHHPLHRTSIAKVRAVVNFLLERVGREV
jgi:hypothetical protein